MKNQGEPGRTQLKYKLVNQFKSTSYKEYIKTLRKINPFNLCIFYMDIRLQKKPNSLGYLNSRSECRNGMKMTISYRKFQYGDKTTTKRKDNLQEKTFYTQ